MKIAVLVCFFVFALFFVVLFVPFKIGMKAFVDFAHNGGFYCFRLVGIRVLCGRMKIKKGKIVVENQHRRLQDNPESSELLPIFVAILYRNVDVVALDLYFEGGKTDDPHMSALLCGGVEVATSIAFAFLKSKNQSGSFRKNISFVPTETECNFVLDGAVAVSIFDLLRSFVEARIEVAKSVQNKNKENEK